MLRVVRLALVRAAAPARLRHLPAFLHLAGDGQDAQGFIVYSLLRISCNAIQGREDRRHWFPNALRCVPSQDVAIVRRSCRYVAQLVNATSRSRAHKDCALGLMRTRNGSNKHRTCRLGGSTLVSAPGVVADSHSKSPSVYASVSSSRTLPKDVTYPNSLLAKSCVATPITHS